MSQIRRILGMIFVVDFATGCYDAAGVVRQRGYIVGAVIVYAALFAACLVTAWLTGVNNIISIG